MSSVNLMVLNSTLICIQNFKIRSVASAIPLSTGFVRKKHGFDSVSLHLYVHLNNSMHKYL